MTRSIMSGLLAATALFGVGTPHAAIFCATDSAGLQEALDLAEVNDEADHVRIAVGTYLTPSGGFVYDAESIDGDPWDITLSGGWSVEDSCAQRLEEDPLLTVLDGHGMDPVLYVYVRDSTNIEIRLLTFTDGSTGSGGAGLRIGSLGQGSVLVERNAFIANNSGNWGGGLHATGGTGILRVVNNLFIDNDAFIYSAATLRRGETFVINNTVLNNTSDQPIAGIEVHGVAKVVVANNNMWGNGGGDLHVSNSGPAFEYVLVSNNIDVRTGADPHVFDGNISSEPVYEPGLLNFTPVFGSPLFEGGFHPPEGALWNLTGLDLRGGLRVVGPLVDIGAYENPKTALIFADGFDPAP